MCLCVHVLRSLLFPSSRGRTLALSSECKTDQAHFTDWMSFLESILMGEIGPNPEFLAQIPNVFNQHRIAKKIKKIWRKMVTIAAKKEIAEKYYSKYFGILN